MKSWKAVGPHNVMLESCEPEKVGPKQVKLKMLASSISDTELMMYQGKLGMSSFPIILGRQGVGMISEVGQDVVGFRRGDTVYIRPQIYCGECSMCRSGREDMCEHARIYGKTANGLLRDFVVADQSSLYKLPERIDTHEASMLEMIALAKSTVDRINVSVGDYVIISGASCLGLLIAQVAIYCQAIPIVLDVDPARLQISEKIGIYYTINVGEENINNKIFAITGGKLGSAAVYTIPEVVPFRQLFSCLSVGGRATFAAIESNSSDLTINIGTVLDKNITVSTVSSVGLSIPTAINMLASNKINVKPFMSRCKFDEVGTYLKKMTDETRRFMFLSVVY